MPGASPAVIAGGSFIETSVLQRRELTSSLFSATRLISRMPAYESSYKQSVLVFFTMTFTIFLLFSSFDSTVRERNGHSKGLLSWQEVLDRKLLFRGAIPNVRSSNIPTFDIKEFTVAVEELRTIKMSQKLDFPPEYFDFKEINASKVDMSRTLHIAFVGDSRIRQLFSMFMTVIPDYDRLVYPLDANEAIAGHAALVNEVVVYSKLQGLVVSFYWRGLLVDKRGNELMSKFFSDWIVYDKNETHVFTPHPDVLVVGISLHHMVRKHMVYGEEFFEALKKLVPILQEISKNCRIIWLNQYPTLELYGDIDSVNTDVHAMKIMHYNEKAEKILRAGGIAVWNSASPIVEEYIRSCGKFERQDGKWRNYFSCMDYVHPGTSALTDTVQILYNIVFSNKPQRS